MPIFRFFNGYAIVAFNDIVEIFFSKISSNNSSIRNNKILFEKGIIEFNNSVFDIDFSLLINDSEIPIIIKGSIPGKNNSIIYLI